MPAIAVVGSIMVFSRIFMKVLSLEHIQAILLNFPQSFTLTKVCTDFIFVVWGQSSLSLWWCYIKPSFSQNSKQLTDSNQISCKWQIDMIDLMTFYIKKIMMSAYLISLHDWSLVALINMYLLMGQVCLFWRHENWIMTLWFCCLPTKIETSV